MACDAPETEAPDLLAPLTGGNSTTYFVKQPDTTEEVERACKAIKVCCVNDLRYGGTDPAIIQRINNDSTFSDYVIQKGQVILCKKATKESSRSLYAVADANCPITEEEWEERRKQKGGITIEEFWKKMDASS